MANHYHQLSLKDTFSDCKDLFMDDVPSFFQLLEQHFDISLFIPVSFYHAFYQILFLQVPITMLIFFRNLKKFQLHRQIFIFYIYGICKYNRTFHISYLHETVSFIWNYRKIRMSYFPTVRLIINYRHHPTDKSLQ